MPDELNPRLYALDSRGQLWPISTVANGKPIGEVVNPEDFATGEASPATNSAAVLAFLDALNPAEVERLAMARLGIGDAETGPTASILAVLRELATP